MAVGDNYTAIYGIIVLRNAVVPSCYTILVESRHFGFFVGFIGFKKSAFPSGVHFPVKPSTSGLGRIVVPVSSLVLRYMRQPE